MTPSDTIAAISTASGKGGIGIVRVSGPQARAIGEAMSRRKLDARHAYYGDFSSSGNEVIDQGITLFFPAPNSFTGEDVVELQAHGSHIILDLLLEETLQLGARLARPGEFSERAFLNDKIDLLQAEAIADIIESSSRSAARSALNSLQGEFSERINQLAESILALRIHVEAAIDFPEEEIDFIADQRIADTLQQQLNAVEEIYQSAQRGSLLNRGLNLLILGKPNAGKSSLLNALAGQEQAIVTAQAGTTRDVLRETIELDGLPIKVIDTAGLRQSGDEIEQEGIRRAASETATADIVVFMQDASAADVELSPSRQQLEQQLELFGIALPGDAALILVNNKADLTGQAAHRETRQEHDVIFLSAKHKQGLELLADSIREFFKLNRNTENSFTARRRHLDCLQRSLEHLQRGQQQLAHRQAGELLAEDLRQAHDALGEITGKVIADDLLGEIFSSFCIGK